MKIAFTVTAPDLARTLAAIARQAHGAGEARPVHGRISASASTGEGQRVPAVREDADDRQS